MEKVDFTQGILAIQPDLHRFAYKLTADRESANDLVQDCLLQALDNQEKFTYSKNLKGWMYTLMRNIFVNNYRRTVREMNLIDDSYSINQQHLIEDEDADRFEFTYDMKQLYRVIHSIPEEMKVPFQMFVAGFKYREIAEKLGLPMGTVKSRLFFMITPSPLFYFLYFFSRIDYNTTKKGKDNKFITNCEKILVGMMLHFRKFLFEENQRQISSSFVTVQMPCKQ